MFLNSFNAFLTINSAEFTLKYLRLEN